MLRRTDHHDLTITTSVQADRALIHLAGELDAATRPDLAVALDGLSGGGTQHFTIDVAGLTFVGVAGAHVILDLAASISVVHHRPGRCKPDLLADPRSHRGTQPRDADHVTARATRARSTGPRPPTCSRSLLLNLLGARRSPVASGES
ncbi:MAG: STAS domain-containing protein [Actinobacteria bacterium]|nr:STAS domain-containing protein [Actinomycetota bacterium]